MADDDWVADVKRWVQTRQPSNPQASHRQCNDSTAVVRIPDPTTPPPIRDLGMPTGGLELR